MLFTNQNIIPKLTLRCRYDQEMEMLRPVDISARPNNQNG